MAYKNRLQHNKKLINSKTSISNINKSDDFLRMVYRRIDDVEQKCDVAMAKSKDHDVTDLINKLIKSDKFVLKDKFTINK